MKTKKFLAVLIVLTITTSALALTTGNIPIIYPIQNLFVSEKGIEQPFPKTDSQAKAPIVETIRAGQNVLAVEQTAEQDNKEVPDEVVYFILFHHLVGLKKESEKVAARGKTLDYYKMYEEQAALSDTQSLVLFETAQKCMDAVEVIDNKAKEIIVRERVKFKEIKSQNDKIPLPPIQLTELQKQKDKTVLRYRDEFKSFLGADKFVEFNEFARQKITPQVTNLDKREEK